MKGPGREPGPAGWVVIMRRRLPFPNGSVRASTLEFFLDLVFVFTITQLTGALVSGGGAAAIAQVVVMFLLIWWMYDGYAVLVVEDGLGGVRPGRVA